METLSVQCTALLLSLASLANSLAWASPDTHVHTTLRRHRFNRTINSLHQPSFTFQFSLSLYALI
jgi:hypothetical protein